MIEDKKVYFHLRKRRYKCLACGATFYERLLFVERYQRRTASLNQQALTYASENSFTMAAKMCGITTSSLLRIFDKRNIAPRRILRSEEHTSELQSRGHLVCPLLLDKKKTII